MASSISFGGLASGMDTNSIIDKLVELQSAPITALKKRQDAVRSQVSALGDISSRLAALETAAKSLGTGGVLASKSTGTYTAFSAVPGAGASPGSFRLQVTELAQTAKARSVAFAAGDKVTGGNLALTVQGKPYTVQIADGASLEDVAYALRTSGAPVSATVLNDGTSRYLSVAPLASGYPLDKTADDALSITHSVTGSQGKALGFAITQPAVNAEFTVDGLPFTRASNSVSDALPGITLTLKQKGGPAEDLVLETDLDGTKARLQSFVDAYNGVLKLVHRELAVAANTDRSKTLGGDSSLRSLQGRLQKLISAEVQEDGAVRSLADLGLKTQSSDGSLTVDTTAFNGAIARDPAAVDALFSTATKGVQALTSALVQAFTKPGSGRSAGILSARKESLDRSITRMGDDLERMQARVESYRETLVKRFTAMEEAVGKIKSTGTFLNAQFAQKSSS